MLDKKNGKQFQTDKEIQEEMNKFIDDELERVRKQVEQEMKQIEKDVKNEREKQK